MATIALYANKINQMPGFIKDIKKSVSDYKSELFSLKSKTLTINKSVCNLDDVISSIQSSSQTQEQKIASLDTFSQNTEQFIADAARIDSDVADVVKQRKDDFYEKYYYLKPECEKNGWEKFCDGCKSVGEWCKENWESICNIILVALVVVAIVALCVLTFGAAAVITAALVGAVVGFVSQLASDIISWAITGNWSGNWQSYFGAILGGAVGGVLMLTGNPVAACAADAAISTFFSENLENITGGTKRSSFEIWAHTFLSAGTAAIFSKGFGKISGTLSKNLATTFPRLSRLAGQGSYDAAYRMVLTKLANGQIKNITIKTFRNGIVSGLMGDVLKNITGGIADGIQELFERQKRSPQN